MTNKVLILLFISLILGIHISWINFQGILTDGDFSYIPLEALKTIRADYFTTWLSDFNFGRPLIDLSQAPHYFLPGLFANLFGWGFEISERIVYFIPILFFGLVGSYKLFNYIFKGDFSATFVGMSIYLLNTYNLSLQTGHITLAVAYSIFPLGFYFLHKGFTEKKLGSVIISGLIFLVLGFYETRLLLVSAIILFIYFCFFVFKRIKIYYLYIVIFGLIIILGNLFWILPFKFLGLEGEGTLGRSLFGGVYWTLQNSLTLHQSWWNYYTGIEVFTASPNVLIYFLYPVYFITSILYIYRKNNLKYRYFLFSFAVIIAIIGIFLGKMSSAPFQDTYSWMYYNIPFFNAFREPTKFYLITVVGYSIAIGYFITLLKGRLKYISVLLFFILGFGNLLVQFQYNRQLLDEKKAPVSYSAINNLLKEDTGFSRVLWVPKYDKWGFYSKNHPQINIITGGAIDKTQNEINYTPIYYGIDFYNNTSIFLKNYLAESYLRNWGVKYLVLPEDGSLFENYGKEQDPNIWNSYYNLLRDSKFLTEISVITDKTKIFILNGSHLPRIFSTKTSNFLFKDYSHTEYAVSFNLKQSASNFVFLESFHPEWNLYLEPYSQLDCRNKEIVYSGMTTPEVRINTGTYTIKPNDTLLKISNSFTGITVNDILNINPTITNGELLVGKDILIPIITSTQAQEPYITKECPSEDRANMIRNLLRLWEKPIFDNSHAIIYDYANQWTIDPEYIKTNYSPEYYRINPDGSMDIRMTLYFRPQSYFYFGLIISLSTLFLIISYLGFYRYKNRSNRQNH